MEMNYFDELRSSVLPGEYKVIGGKPQIIPSICPYCGKSNEREMHSSYGVIFPNDGEGYKCFACGYSASLAGLYSSLTGRAVDDTQFKVTLPPTKERKVAAWRKDANRYLARFTASQSRYQAWYDYKKLSRDIVDKYHLGVGVLPASRFRDIRLVVPIIQNGEVVMFRGRRISGNDAKWSSSGGVSPADIQLPFVENVKQGDIVFIVENPVDAILVTEFSRATGVAALSTNYWYPHWTARLKEAKPSLVVTAFDNDVAGEGASIDRVIEVARERVAKIHHSRYGVSLEKIRVVNISSNARGWRISWASGDNEGVITIPTPAGVQRRNELLKAGIAVASMPWDSNEDKLDIGALYERSVSNENT